MKRTFRISRFDPEKDRESHFGIYEVETEPSDRILDCLNRIRWEQDASIGFRMSCGHGVCGSDAMKINGKCGLACQKLVKDFENDEISVEPLPSFRVLKDLIVDMHPFLEKVALIRPYLVFSEPPPEKERKQDKEDNEKINEIIRCILCACCTAACPITGENEDYLGPACFVRAFRYIFDSRNEDTVVRLKQVDHPDGVWGCVNHFECTRVCPKEIKITKSINTIKREIEKRLQK
jgi:succinate dehydrogenase / fumarate reductase iron-sulfur subunit